jgi:hypothetical protein
VVWRDTVERGELPSELTAVSHDDEHVLYFKRDDDRYSTRPVSIAAYAVMCCYSLIDFDLTSDCCGRLEFPSGEQTTAPIFGSSIGTGVTHMLAHGSSLVYTSQLSTAVRDERLWRYDGSESTPIEAVTPVDVVTSWSLGISVVGLRHGYVARNGSTHAGPFVWCSGTKCEVCWWWWLRFCACAMLMAFDFQCSNQ